MTLMTQSIALQKRNTYSHRSIGDLYTPQIAILMDDVSELDTRKWIDLMELWTGADKVDDPYDTIKTVFTALCHCNQINNKLTSYRKREIEDYLLKKRKSWTN